MNRDYFTKPIQHSRSAHDYGNSGPILPPTPAERAVLLDYPLTGIIIFLVVVALVAFWPS